MPYLVEGLNAGEACMCVLEPEGAERLRQELVRTGIDVEAATVDGRLHLETDRPGRRAVGAVVARVVDEWREARDGALTGGFSGLRVAVDVLWAVDDALDDLTLDSCESAIDRLATDRGLTFACLYDCRSFPAATIEHLLASHPVVLWNWTPCTNLYYEPPDVVDANPRARLEWKLERLAENRQLMDDLTESQARFRAIFNQAAVGMAVVGPEGNSQLANPALEAMLGYSEGEIRDRTFREILHPEDRARAEGHFRAHFLSGDGPRRDVWRFLDASGGVVWAETSATLLRGGGAP